MILDADDVALLKQYVLHEKLLVVLDRDKKAVNTSAIKIKEPYIYALEEAEKETVLKMTDLKKQMNKRGIKILSEENTDYGTTVKYLARGYEHTVEYWGGNMRAEIWVLMNRYVFRKSDEEI